MHVLIDEVNCTHHNHFRLKKVNRTVTEHLSTLIESVDPLTGHGLETPGTPGH